MAAACGPLAQLVEQGTLNPKVEGSNPSRPTTFPPSSPYLVARLRAEAANASAGARAAGGNKTSNDRTRPGRLRPRRAQDNDVTPVGVVARRFTALLSFADTGASS